ncbi:MAG: FAD-dependent oxidoreductase, partial [Alphaproteobacteria bacterium]|nr:FAD-dependent oxidoreductase [Alphaproteobacteria bacterium]
PTILLSEEGYLIPRRDGLVLAGSTLEPGVSDSLPTEEGARQLQAMAGALMPSLFGRQPVAQWAGVRPGCARPEPVIRPLGDAGSRTWLVGGHYRNGLVSAPATARLLAELFNDEPPCVDPSPYR